MNAVSAARLSNNKNLEPTFAKTNFWSIVANFWIVSQTLLSNSKNRRLNFLNPSFLNPEFKDTKMKNFLER